MTGRERLLIPRQVFAVLLFLLLYLGQGQFTLAKRDQPNPGPFTNPPGRNYPHTEVKDRNLSEGVLVRFRDGRGRQLASKFFAEHNLHVVRHIPHIDVWHVTSSEVPGPVLAHQLKQNNHILWVEPNGLVHAAGITPDDNFYQAQQGNLRLIGLPEAWVFSTGDAVPIAIIDTGVDLDHPDLSAKIWTNTGEIPGNGLDDDENGYTDDVHGWNFVHGDAVPQDDNSHGSHVAGIAAAHTNNATGIAGVSWNSPVMPLKALDSRGDGTWADVAAAIVYAADNGARILNLSLGGDQFSQTIKDAVLYARSQGCLIVAATGNGGAAVDYPAALPQVLAVAATDYNDSPWTFSNYGAEVDLAAPGVDIFSASRQGSYYQATGTSTAAPHVSGVAALLWSLRPELTADQVAQVITSTVRDVWAPGWDQRTGWGRIDAYAAVLHIVQPQVDIASDRESIVVGTESVTLTTTVTHSSGQAAPDDLTVSFFTSSGSVTPQTGLTHGGLVTTTFSSQWVGQVIITASIGYDFQDAITITVTPHTYYFPFIGVSGAPR